MDETPHGLIIVGVDGSDGSLLALREAAEIAPRLGLPLRAVTVWENPDFVRWDAEDDAERQSTAAADGLFGENWPSWFDTEVVGGAPADILIEASKHARILVIGTRGHGGIAGLLLGSVSTQCIRQAHCPVLVVRSPSESSDPVVPAEDAATHQATRR
jgi:nucleotide-binding universal stress UspA family protein